MFELYGLREHSIGFLLLFAISDCYSTNWSAAETLLESTVGRTAVQALHIDSLNRAWIGTQNGLLLYDGRREDRFSRVEAPPWDADVVGVAETSAGEIIALTHSQGIFRKRRGGLAFQRISVPAGLSLAQAKSLQVDELDVAWIVTNTGLVVLHATGSVDRNSNNFAVLSGDVTSRTSAVLSSGAPCIGTTRGVVCAHNAEAPRPPFVTLYGAQDAPNCSTVVTSLVYDDSGERLIAGTRDGELVLIDENGYEPPRCLAPLRLSGARITHVLQTANGFLLGTDRGVFQANTDLKDVERVGEETRQIASLVPHNGSVWALSETGLHHLAESKFEVWRGIGDSRVDVTALAGRSNREVLIGSYDGLFAIKSGGEASTSVALIDADGEAIQAKITALAERAGILYVGTRDQGVLAFRRNFESSFLLTDRFIGESGVTAISSTETGVIFGTYGSGSYYLRDGRLSKVRLSPWASNTQAPVTSITPISSEDTKVVVTTERQIELLCLDESPYVCGEAGTTSALSPPRLLSTSWCGNQLWVGTLNAGLYRLDRIPKGQHNVVLEPQVPTLRRLSVYHIVCQEDQNLWVSTNDGVWHIEFETLESSRYSSAQGQTVEDFNHGAGLKIDGAIMFGSPFGLLKFSPNEISDTAGSHRVHLAAIGLGSGGRQLRIEELPKLIEVPPSPNAITIRLNIGEFVAPTETRFRYKLEGHHTHWIDNGDNAEVRFSNLPPGDYVFRARGAAASGVWSSNEISVPVRVLPPWWMTWPAYVVYAFAALAFLLLIKRASEVGALRASRDQLEIEVSLSQEREVDELQAHIEATSRIADRSEARSMDLLTCIDEILETGREDVAEADRPKLAAKTASRVHALRMLQQFVSVHFDDAVIDMNSFTNLLFDDCIARHAEMKASVITVNNVDLEHVPGDHAVYLALILREFVENAFAHAFPWAKDGAVIAARIDLLPSTMLEDVGYLVCVEDNGTGPMKFEEETAFDRDGLGLVHRLCESLGGSMEVSDVGGTRAEAKVYFRRELD